MLKRLAAGLLCLLLLLGLLPASALAADVSGDWEFEVSEDEATVTKYNGNEQELHVPNYLGGRRVTGIGPRAFSGCSSLTVVYIPSGIRRIGSAAFSGTSLTAVRIENLKAWCAIEFQDASANPLSSGNVSLYKYDSARDNYQLVRALTGLYGIRSIGNYAFYNYKKLTEAEIPYSVQTIGVGAFSGCTALETVGFSYGLESIGNSAFSGCTALTEVTLPDGLESIGDSAFSGCTALTGVELPGRLESIGSSAFSGCRALARLVFPSELGSIGSNAFNGCGITDVYLEDLAAWCGIDFPNPGSNPLNNAKNLYVRDVPMTDLVLPEGIRTVKNYAFYGFQGAECLILPEDLSIVNKQAFQGCANLESLLIPDSVLSFAVDAFASCRSISDVYYTGSRYDWEAVANHDREPFTTATIHYDTPKYTVVLSAGDGYGEVRTNAIGDRPYVLPGCSFSAPYGYKFKAWEINGEEFAEGNVFLPAEHAVWNGEVQEVQITALWTDVTYIVRFDPGEGSGSMEPVTVLFGNTYPLPACPFTAPQGKTFKAWRIDGSEYAAGAGYSPWRDVTATALWKDITYTITFDPGEGSGSMAAGTAVYGRPFSLPKCSFAPPEDPEAPAQFFKAWKLGDTDELLPENGSFIAEADMTVTAVWGDLVTLSFDANGGAGTMEAIPAAAGNCVRLPECGFTAPEGTGFRGWLIGETKYEPGETITLDGDLTAKAVWVNRYTVTYDAGGGSGIMESVTVFEGTVITLPDCAFLPPADKGRFRAWQIAEQDYAPGDHFTVNADTTVKAAWMELYTMTFLPGEGSGSMSPLQEEEGYYFVLPECSFTAPEGMGFKAWLIGGEEYGAGRFYQMTEDTAATAVWSELRTVTFDAGGGTGTMEPVQIPAGLQLVLPHSGFTPPEDMAFKTWRIGDVKYLPNECYLVSEDTTVTAVWDALRTVTFDANGGTGTMEPWKLAAGTWVELPECGFTPPHAKFFKGWRIADREYAPNSSYQVKDDTVVAAVWDDLFNVFFDANGGSGSMGAQAVRRGETVTLPPCEFTPPSGSVFEAWRVNGVKYTVGTTLIPSGNIEVAAVWNSRYECSVSNGETTVTRYKGNEAEARVPEILMGFPVTGIGDGAFSGCNTLTRVILPEGVRTIGANAFSDCRKLLRADLPSSLAEVGTNAFSGCIEMTGVYITDLAAWCSVAFANAAANPTSAAKNLYLNEKLVTELSVPAGVTGIGSYAFYGCIRLERVDASLSSITDIGSYAFANCTGLTEVGKLPGSLRSIGSYAFSGCTGLVNIQRFPDGLRSIGSYAFSGCTGLINVEGFPGGLTSLGSAAFSGCTSLNNVVLPSGLTHIASGAFSDCSGLKDLTVPAGITGMGSNAFSGCRIDVVRVADLAAWCRIDFENQNSNPLNNARSLYFRNAPVTDLTIQDEITSIGNYAFAGFQGLKCVIIPQNAAVIYRSAFTGCGNLEYVLIPVGMQSIGENAFANCGSLTDIYYTGTEVQWRKELPNTQQLETDGVTLHFNAKAITVTLDPGEGSGTPEQTSAISGRPYVLGDPSFTAPAGKHFTAWRVDGQDYLRGQSFTPTESVTATALWGDTIYQLTLSPNGGSGEMENLTAKEGTALTLPECGFTAPVGKQFKAWQIGGLEYAPGDEFLPDRDGAALALWEPLVCVIGFDANGGSGTMEPLTTTYKVAVALPECTFEPQEGKVFKAWNVSGRERQPGYAVSPTESLTVTAVWQDIRCVVSFDPGTGSGGMSSKTYVYGTEYALPRCSFAAPEGQGFRAWEIDGVRCAVGDVITVKKDTVVTAIWADLHQVSFDPNGGTRTMNPKTVVDGDALELPACSFRAPATGLQFRCWEIEGEEYKALALYTPTTDVTAYAVWEPVPCVITFDAGDGRTETMVWDYGYEYPLPECMLEPPIDLHFKAWKQGTTEYAPGDVIVPKSNMTFAAVWTGLYLFTVDNGQTTVTAYNGDETELVIPDTLGGYPVKVIGANAFANLPITSVTIPDGVTSIGTGAFSGCAALARVTMPEGLLGIERRAFYNCAKLESAAIPGSVTAIGSEAFSGCKCLTTVRMPKSLTSVGSNAFNKCTELTGVYITDLEGWCGVSFENANSNPVTFAKNLYLDGKPVEQLSFPEDSELTAIGNYTFNNCVWMTEATLPEGLRSIGYNAFSGCIRLESVELPGSLESIGSSAFSGCTGLKEITLPGNLTSVGASAFSGCSGMKAATLPESLTAIPETMFANCSSLACLELPEGVTLIGASAFSGCGGLQELTVPASVTDIQGSAFQNCGGLMSVYVTDLAAWCGIHFANATSNPLYYARNLYFRGVPVTDLTIQDNISVIRTYAFNHFQGLRCVIVPQKATVILRDTFTNCANLEYILLPEGMESLGDNAFNNSKKLHDVYFTGTEEQWKSLPNYQQFVKDGITVHYNAEKITITFDASDGAGTREETSAISGRAYVLAGCAFKAPEGKAFRAWKIGEEEYAVGDSFTPTEDVTVTALWTDVITASVEGETLSYQINVPIPEGAVLFAAGYNGEGRQLWTAAEDSPGASGKLTVSSAQRIKLFLLDGAAAPVCRSWDSDLG